MASTTPDEILDFWFGGSLDSPDALAEHSRLWFSVSDEFDRDINTRFGSLPERAAAGEFESWRSEPRSLLALVLVLDQFPRNLFRDSARSFEFDPAALEIARTAVEAGFDSRLHPVEAIFLYMPFEHAEDLAMQDRAVELLEKLASTTPPPHRSRVDDFASYARSHRAVVARFGRFPHRNTVVGRQSTAEEVTYIESGGESFSGKKQD